MNKFSFKDWLEFQESIASGLAAFAAMGTPHETPQAAKPAMVHAEKYPTLESQLASIVPLINKDFERFKNLVVHTTSERNFGEIQTKSPNTLKFIQNTQQLAEKLNILEQHFLDLQQDINEGKLEKANVALNLNIAEILMGRMKRTLQGELKNQEQMDKVAMSTILSLDDIFKLPMQMLK